MKLLLFIFLINSNVFAFTINLPTIGRLQSSAAKGKLLCNGKPYKGAKIKLYDIDTSMRF